MMYDLIFLAVIGTVGMLVMVMLFSLISLIGTAIGWEKIFNRIGIDAGMEIEE